VCGIERYPLDAVVAGLPTEPNESVAGSVWNALDYSNGTEFAQCRRLDDKRQSAIKHIAGTRSVRLAWRADSRPIPGGRITEQSPSRIRPGSVTRSRRGLSQSKASDLPSRRCRRCRDGSTECLPRTPSETWPQSPLRPNVHRN